MRPKPNPPSKLKYADVMLGGTLFWVSTGFVLTFCCYSSAYSSPVLHARLPKHFATHSTPTRPINIFNKEGRDPREPVDLSRDRALRPVVQIRGSTAFLVSPCYALAAYHGVFGSSTPDENQPSVEVAIPHPHGDGSSFDTVAASPAVWGDGHVQSAIREDWVLLKLATCVGKHVGWLELRSAADRRSLTGEPVTIMGYPNDVPKPKLWRDSTGRIEAEGAGPLRDCLLNSAATRGGNSGSPLFVNEAGVPVVVGIQVRERNSYHSIIPSYDERWANIAVDIRPVAWRIELIITADKDAFWAERPERAGQNPAHN